MKKQIRNIFLMAIAVLCFASCSLLNQIAGIANLVNCTYSLNNVTDIYVAGVSVKNVTNGNITATDVVKLTAALATKKVPLTMNVNVDVTNPTATSATVTAMDWVCEMDGVQMATGSSSKSYTIAPNGKTKVSLPVSADVYTLFSSKGLDALKSFVTGFNSNGTNDKISIGIRPTLSVGELHFPSPSYINIVGKCKTAPATNNNTQTTTAPVSTGKKK